MKIKKLIYTTPLIFMLFVALLSFKKHTESTTYKCLIQMKNYSGEGAYIVISLLNPELEYEETLYVQGPDDEWYFDITEWWRFQGKKRTAIDAITGATVSGGERNVSIIQIPNDKVDSGYSIRFESAVEDKGYYKSDVEFELTSENIKAKNEGTGFIRYVRILPK